MAAGDAEKARRRIAKLRGHLSSGPKARWLSAVTGGGHDDASAQAQAMTRHQARSPAAEKDTSASAPARKEGYSRRAVLAGVQECAAAATPNDDEDEEGLQPFHLAFPVHDLKAARHFYGEVLGCEEGRSAESWVDYSLQGHQIVCHLVGPDFRAVDYHNPVDAHDVPVPHFGIALTVPAFKKLAARLKAHNTKFIIEPYLRFKGLKGEQYTMFFKDPSGNNLEFKAMTNPENLFAKQ
ncbi:Glyoxalase domain-containing protein 5 [Hondaea fermentalgiana]|uniref:Glyoxalase domain-containing protein 5 n=1 Tax=Hondaea fermentalgiana TaxID=2315210 RepID=A0A2R5G8L3_9STRA|nr:Glyoxalase domain-containing protein 5 [Hondaea fermentalgiana]|eukprot:GBG24014.1 Glyoxalase domain-containing protein 5 [Hondaea fermentalgiana]